MLVMILEVSIFSNTAARVMILERDRKLRWRDGTRLNNARQRTEA
jgi:hypothetical protein